MSNYERVLPRDLFNEASLIKCVGRLWILLDEKSGHDARIEEESVPMFDIVQDDASGSISIANLTFTIAGVRHQLVRPLNSRNTWPLWVEREEDPDFEAVEVFDEQGGLSDDMLALIGMED